MSKPLPSPIAELKDEIGSLADDFKEMAALRWQLARLEGREAAYLAKRLGIGLALAAVAVLAALPVLCVAAAWWLGEVTNLSSTGWLLIFGLGLLLGGVAGGYLAWRHFRRRFTGIRQTLEELREDLVWLEEWAGRREARASADEDRAT